MRKFNWVIILFFAIGMSTFQSCEKDDPEPPAPPTTPAPAPVACWSATITITQTGLPAEFTNCSLNAVKYIWDFGDGNTSTEKSPTHVYENYGDYVVKLTAINSDGVENDFVAGISVHHEPSKMVIQEIKVLKWPETNNGTSWDPNSTADLYPKLIQNNPSLELYTSSTIVDDVVQGTPVIFGIDSGLPVTVSNLDKVYSFEFYDRDTNADENMGKIQFSPKDYKDVAIGKITLNNGIWEVELSFTW